MRLLLLATSALAGTALLVPAANAVDLAPEFQDGAVPVVQRQPAFAVRLAGRVRVEANIIEQDIKGMKPSGRLREAVELAVIGTATADNGLSYGFNYDVDKNRGEVHLANRFGRLTMGNTFTATDSLDVGGTSVLVGRGHWAGGGDALLNGIVYGLGTVSHTRPHGLRGIPMGHVGGPTIRYTTPNYGGLTIAVSFTSETLTEKDGSDIDGNGLGKYHAEDVWSVAGQYTSSYGNYTTVLYAGYEAGNRTLKDDPAYGLHNGRHDTKIWSVGAKVTGQGFGFGIGYGKRIADHWGAGPVPVTFDDDYEWFDIAASFSSGPWAVSGGYGYIRRDDMDIGAFVLLQEEIPVFVAANTPQKMEVWSLSANYRAAPGLSFAGGFSIYDIKNADSALGQIDNDATTLSFATIMQF